MSWSIVDNQDLARSFAPAAVTVTANGTSVQSGADAYGRAAILDLGLYVDGTFVFKLQRSTDDSVWNDMLVGEIGDSKDALDAGLLITDVAIITVGSVALDNVIHQVDLLTIDEFTRWVVTVTGGPGTGMVFGAVIQTGHPLRFAGDKNPMKPDGYRADPIV